MSTETVVEQPIALVEIIANSEEEPEEIDTVSETSQATTLQDGAEQVPFIVEYVSPVELYQATITPPEVDEIHLPVTSDPSSSLDVGHSVLSTSPIQTVWGEEIHAEAPASIAMRQDTALYSRRNKEDSVLQDQAFAATTENLQNLPADGQVPFFKQSSSTISPLQLDHKRDNHEQQSSNGVLHSPESIEATTEDLVHAFQAIEEEIEDLVEAIQAIEEGMELDIDHTPIMFSHTCEASDELGVPSELPEVDELDVIEPEPEHAPDTTEVVGSPTRIPLPDHVSSVELNQPCSNHSMPEVAAPTEAEHVSPSVYVNASLSNQLEVEAGPITVEAEHSALATQETQTSQEGINQAEVDELVRRVRRRTARFAAKTGRPQAASEFTNTFYSPFGSKKRRMESAMAALSENKRRRPGTPHPGEMDMGAEYKSESSEFDASR